VTPEIVEIATTENVVEVKLRLEQDRQLGLRIALDVEIVAHRGPRAARRVLTCSTTWDPRPTRGTFLDNDLRELTTTMRELIATGTLELRATERRRAITEAPCECGAVTWSTTEPTSVNGIDVAAALRCTSCGRTWTRAASGWVFDTGTEPAPKVGRPRSTDDSTDGSEA
jgi:hypothetical protein